MITLQDHYNRIAVEGQEYDPYTTMFARARMGEFGEKKIALEEDPVPVK
jgi:divinyl chlorophyllide a 8-vinyl-reductase